MLQVYLILCSHVDMGEASIPGRPGTRALVSSTSRAATGDAPPVGTSSHALPLRRTVSCDRQLAAELMFLGLQGLV